MNSWGIDPTRVDSTPQYDLGRKEQDPRSEYPGNKIRYIRADSAITAGQALTIKTDESDKPWSLIPTSAVAQPVVAIAHVDIGQDKYGWVTVEGVVDGANVAASTSAGARLGSSASAGVLQALTIADSNFTSNTFHALVAYAGGVRAVALDANDSNGDDIQVVLGG